VGFYIFPNWILITEGNLRLRHKDVLFLVGNDMCDQEGTQEPPLPKVPLHIAKKSSTPYKATLDDASAMTHSRENESFPLRKQPSIYRS
jgi:hypothetical protein